MKKRFFAWAVVASGATVALGLTVGAYQISKQPLDEFLSRMTVMGEPVTAESVEALLATEEARMNDFLSVSVEWSAETGSLVATPSELGLGIAFERLEQELEELDQSTWGKLWLTVQKRDFAAPAYVNDEVMMAAFEGSGIEQGMKNASYFYDNGVQIDPDQTGYGIEYDELADQLIALWDNQDLDATVALPFRVSEADISTELLESHVEQVAQLTSEGLTIQENDGTEWNLNLRDHLDWILPSEEGFILNDTAFYSFVRDEIAEDVEEEAQPVTITVTEEGSYEFEGSARYGRAIDYEATLLAVQEEINAEERKPVVLIVNEVDPEITVPESLALLGVTDLLGYGYSTFSGSPTNRIYNVNHGMDLFNGTLVAPGEEFSFTTLMGPIDAAHGWYPELVIKGDETIPEYGGGLCQVSSTMFRAALLTGMPITARQNHSYAVSYYAYPDGYGLDATVYDPNPDFRFLNDTQAHILIQGYTEGTSAYFVFYGTNDGRSVTMEKGDAYGYYKIEEPKIEYTNELEPGVRVLDEYSHTGFKIDWWRTITYADGTTSERENFHSDYEARPAKYLEGKAAGEIEE